ncbi:MAG: sulfur carrier protein ThiS [Chloroflexota bacterium]
MDLTVNGKARRVDGPISLTAFIESLGINPKIVAVERNGEIVKRATFESVLLQAGDRLEIVRMVGGG